MAGNSARGESLPIWSAGQRWPPRLLHPSEPQPIRSTLRCLGGDHAVDRGVDRGDGSRGLAHLVDQCASAVGDLVGQRDIPVFPTSDDVEQPEDGNVAAGFTSDDFTENHERDQKRSVEALEQVDVIDEEVRV